MDLDIAGGAVPATIAITPLVSALAAFLALMWIARTHCLRLAARSPAAASVSEAPAGGDEAVTLRPAELAYLIRGGDMSHALIVLCFDLMHRAVKAQGSEGGLTLAPYETRVWGNVKEIARRWVDDKVGAIIPDPRTQTAQELVRRVSGLYTFAVRTVRPFLKEVMADPRNLRRYFQPAGMLRLLADLGSAGYKESVQRELESELSARGLVADDALRLQGSDRLNLLGAAGVLSILVIVLLVSCLPYWAVSIWIFSGLAAAAIRLALMLGEFVPFYRELSDVVDHVKRSGWRLAALRLALKAAALVFFLVAGAALTVTLALTVAAQALVFLIPPEVALAAALAVTGAWLLCLQVFVDAWRLRVSRQPSLAATDAIASARRRLSRVSPFETFKELLVSPAYDPLFSELLALYGIETLWLLV